MTNYFLLAEENEAEARAYAAEHSPGPGNCDLCYDAGGRCKYHDDDADLPGGIPFDLYFDR